MLRVHLPLLPLPVLAAIVAFSACSKASSEPSTHVIPPAAPYAATAEAAAKPDAPSETKPAVAAARGEPAPSAEDVREFERPVRK